MIKVGVMVVIAVGYYILIKKEQLAHEKNN